MTTDRSTPNRLGRYAVASALAIAAAACGGGGGTWTLYEPYRAVECTVDVSPVAAPTIAVSLSSDDAERFGDTSGDLLADYAACLPSKTFVNTPPCPDCVFGFGESDWDSGVPDSRDDSAIEDHWRRLVSTRVTQLGSAADPTDPDDPQGDFARFGDWCAQAETLVCRVEPRPHRGDDCVTPDIVDVGIPDCVPGPPPAGRLVVACSPGVADGCTTARLEAPPWEMVSLQVQVANAGAPTDPEIAVAEFDLQPLGATQPGEFTLRDVPGETSCRFSYPGTGGVHVLANPAADSERASCAVAVDFAPTGPEPRSAQLSFTAAERSYTIAIEGHAPPGVLEAIPETICFPVPSAPDDCTAPATVAIRNEGPGYATIVGLELVEGEPSIPNFEFVPEPPALGPGVVLAPGAGSFDVELRACRSGDPQLPQDIVAELRIDDDTPATPTLVVPIEVSSECPVLGAQRELGRVDRSEVGPG